MVIDAGENEKSLIVTVTFAARPEYRQAMIKVMRATDHDRLEYFIAVRFS